MKKNLLKTVAAVCAMTCLGAFAQNTTPKNEMNKNYVEHRAEIIKKYGITNNISMGWYTGNVDALEIRDLWNNYIVLSNYLSERLGKVVILETEKSDREISLDALKTMDIVYTSAIMASDLVKVGWKPVVGRSENIQGVVLVHANQKIDNVADMKKLKIYGAKGSTVGYLVLHTLIKNGVYKKGEISMSNIDSKVKMVDTKQNQLLDLLKNKEADGLIVRETLANNIIKANPGKYKIGFKADVAPGHMILVGPNVRDDVINQLRDSFLALTPDNTYYKKILSGLDGYQESDKTPFKLISPDFAASLEAVLSNSGEKPIVVAR